MITSTVLNVRPLVIGFLVCWAMLLVVFSVMATMRLSKAVKTGNCCSELLQFGNFFEWMLLITGWLILLFLLLEWHALALFKKHLETYRVSRKDVDRAMQKNFDISWFFKIDSTVQNLEVWGGLAQFTVAFYHIFLVVRL
eukprot:CAMPEP_0172773330 /NCGR_PEP_ID=MMETSP1074-20121228/194087_1 /TAXON_ID=2916 /ORGANISM="Ceratium fusus, Strain PA161109" /LENGTH=139 /DNA_ID=CAMNT_0013609583 /DNA_START=19 /DNA_END=434 /DNA_ORIENTATION=+